MGVGAHRRNERILVSHRHLDRQQAAGHVLQRGRASLADGHRLRGSVGRGFACIGRRGRVDRQRVDTHGQFDLFRAVAVKEVRVRRAVFVGHRYRLAVCIEDFDRVGFNVGVARRPGRGIGFGVVVDVFGAVHYVHFQRLERQIAYVAVVGFLRAALEARGLLDAGDRQQQSGEQYGQVFGETSFHGFVSSLSFSLPGRVWRHR